MLFRIAEENKQRAARAFIAERIPHDYGYKKSAMLYPKSNRIMHYYEIDMIDADRIICTVRHKNNDCIVALVWLSGYTPESIEVDQAELYRNCSNYPYRREYNEKYLKKYDQISCIVHGAIAAGLLFDTVEAPTTEETSETGQDTACTDREPQEATETAQREPETVTGYIVQCRESREDIRPQENTTAPKTDAQRATETAQKTTDMATFRAAFMIALETVGTPQNAPQGTESTTGDQTPTDGEKTPYSATDEATTGGNTITGSGKAITKNTDGGNRITYEATPPRTACENAPQGAERVQAEQVHTPRHKTPPRGKYKATHAHPPKFGKICAKIRVPSGALYFTGAG